MTGQAEALRQGLTAHDRALLKRLVDAELRRRQQAELEQMLAAKRRYLGLLAARKKAYAAA
jgi:hypothetical protein